jgi:hypothetical protein
MHDTKVKITVHVFRLFSLFILLKTYTALLHSVVTQLCYTVLSDVYGKHVYIVVADR